MLDNVASLYNLLDQLLLPPLVKRIDMFSLADIIRRGQ